jgi:Flp pilus assembly pilin Flp
MINTALLRIYTAIKSDERGQDLLEYALLGGLIAAALTAAVIVTIMTGAISGMANGIAECIDFDSTSECGPF